jgi:hypothetical protein
MNPETAHIALQFLSRVDLKGAEAPALMQVLAALEAIARNKGNGDDRASYDPALSAQLAGSHPAA